ncbi:MAG: hypothetical protein KC736_04760, partial [Candidatus Moranbacteria bacterium]|nr:hypothetical protein [Candidatus Moranbacteria bacterium]
KNVFHNNKNSSSKAGSRVGKTVALNYEIHLNQKTNTHFLQQKNVQKTVDKSQNRSPGDRSSVEERHSRNHTAQIWTNSAGAERKAPIFEDKR